MRPVLIVVFGLPGSGKSYFAKRLTERLRIEYVNSDTVRNEMEARRRYSDESRLRIYEAMKHRAEEFLSRGDGVVIDATFTVKGTLEVFSSLSVKHNCALILFRITADESLIKERIQTRRSESEADYRVYEKLKQSPVDTALPYHTLVSTNNNVDEMIETALGIIKQYDARRN